MSVEILGLVVAVLLCFMPLVTQIMKEKRGASGKYQQMLADFEQQVRGELYQGEVVEAVCGYIPCAAVTNRRLLIGTKKGIETVEFNDIYGFRGIDGHGNKTADPSRMLGFTIKARKKYTLGNHSAGFDEVVMRLYEHTGMQRL